MNLLFVINPSSGRRRDPGALERAIERRCARAGVRQQTVRCGERSELDAIVRRAEGSTFDAIVAVGGDGTVHEVGTRLIGSRLALGILPAGSGNGLARHLGLPADPLRALDLLASSEPLPVDTARACGRPFLGVAGVGFDAEIAHRFGLRGRRGLAAYVEEAALLVAGYRPRDYRIEIDGEVIETRALLVAAANSSQYGNEARIAPRASLVDGLLDVCILERPPLAAVPFLLRRLFTGRLQDGEGVTLRRGTSAVVERDEAGPAHLDGEPVCFPSRVAFEIRPRSLTILVPPASRRV